MPKLMNRGDRLVAYDSNTPALVFVCFIFFCFVFFLATCAR